MRVFFLTTGQDTAGQGAALRAALGLQRPTWHVDQMRRSRPPLGYPTQHEWNPSLAARLCAQADVIHLCQNLAGQRYIRRRVVLVVHHHGTLYRQRGAEIDAACRRAGARQVASTVDLLGRPGVEWLPVVFDPALLAPRVLAEGVVRIAHSPTSRSIKGTDHLIEAVARLQDEGLPVRLDLIEGVTWAESIARKAAADIFVDQLFLGYGLSAVEAWAYGIPVVCGVADPVVRERMAGLWDGLPFVEADPDTLTDVLRRLVTDEALRARWGTRGRAHFDRYHSPAAVVERLERVYLG